LVKFNCLFAAWFLQIYLFEACYKQAILYCQFHQNYQDNLSEPFAQGDISRNPALDITLSVIQVNVAD
jgi:hypothetical protein